MICKGYTSKSTNCTRKTNGVETFCNLHQYQLNFTDNEFEEIKSNSGKFMACPKCHRWCFAFEGNKCLSCKVIEKKSNAKQTEKKKEKLKCIGLDRTNKQCRNYAIEETNFCNKHKYMHELGYTEDDMSKTISCSTCHMHYILGDFKTCSNCRDVRGQGRQLVDNSKQVICKFEGCIFKIDTDDAQNYPEYCGKHQGDAKLEDLQGIAEEKGLKLCANDKRCLNMLKKDDPFQTCAECREKDRVYAAKKKNGIKIQTKSKDELIKDDTNYENELMKKMNEEKEKNKNKKRIVHDWSLLTDENEEINKAINKVDEKYKLIANKEENKELYYDSENNISELHEEKQFEEETKKKAQKEIKEHRYHGCQGYDRNYNQCKTLTKRVVNGFCNDHQYFLTELTEEEVDDIINHTHYTSVTQCSTRECGHWHNEETKTCYRCLERGKVKDHKPERIEYRKNWRENNPERTMIYDLTQKEKEMKELDYHAKEAAYAKTYRANNKDKIQEANEKKKNDIYERLKILKRRAKANKIPWALKDDDALFMISSLCHYCNSKTKGACNSIDRMYSDKGYELNNCVSCCDICNYIKNTIDYDDFLKIVEHICFYNKLHLNAHCNYKCNRDCVTNGFSSYRSSAKTRGKPFWITKDEFYFVIQENCYICGKKNLRNENGEITNYNGVDRFDNNVGYVFDNCKACCNSCNMMKLDYDYDLFLEKILNIFINICVNNNYYPNSEENKKIPSKSLTKNYIKKSKDQRQQEHKENIEKQKQNTIAKHTNKEWIAMHAKEHADKKKSKTKIMVNNENDIDDITQEEFDKIDDNINNKKQLSVTKNLEHPIEILKKKQPKLTEEELKEHHAQNQKTYEDKQKIQLGDEDFKKHQALKKKQQDDIKRLELGDEEFKRQNALKAKITRDKRRLKLGDKEFKRQEALKQAMRRVNKHNT